MLFPRVYSRLHADLLVAVPANTNKQESRHHANAAHSPPGQLLRVITHHERLEKQDMDWVYGRGNEGSENHRPLNTERRYIRQAQRSHKSRANTHRHQGAADASMPTFAHEPVDAHEPTQPTLSITATTTLTTTLTATQSTVAKPSRVQHGGGEHRPGASKPTTTATPRLTPSSASSLLPTAKRAGSSAVPTDDDATRPSSPTTATEHPLPTDIRRPVAAAVKRQTAVEEQQLCVAAQQQELLNSLLAVHQPDKQTNTGTSQSPAASSPEHSDVADNKSTHYARDISLLFLFFFCFCLLMLFSLCCLLPAPRGLTHTCATTALNVTKPSGRNLDKVFRLPPRHYPRAPTHSTPRSPPPDVRKMLRADTPCRPARRPVSPARPTQHSRPHATRWEPPIPAGGHKPIRAASRNSWKARYRTRSRNLTNDRHQIAIECT